jgi:hypothetical protein
VAAPAAAGVYRLFLFDPGADGRPNAKAQALACLTDAEAIAEADLRRGGDYAELWKEDCVLRLFEPD